MRFGLPIILLFGFCTSCAQTDSTGHSTVESTDSLVSNEADLVVEEEWVEPPYNFEVIGISMLPDSSKGYKQILNKLERQREELIKSNLEEDSLYQRAGQLFTNYLVNQIIPWWYGTKWAFEGHTNTPNDGQVACGYFVSTTLRHAGIQVNRYHLAQQHGTNEALTLQNDIPLKKYSNSGDYYDGREVVLDSLNQLQNGLYFVGLDYHVGYLLRQNGELFFLHSSYMDPVAVVIEPIDQSEAFWSSERWVLADITHNKSLMKKWLNQEQVVVKRD